jgi:hypothetical protein
VSPVLSLSGDDRLWLLVERDPSLDIGGRALESPFAIAGDTRTEEHVSLARWDHPCGCMAARALATELDDAPNSINGRPVAALAIVSTFFFSDQRDGRTRAFWVEAPAYRAMRKLFSVLARFEAPAASEAA